jgi:hypothetical protein
MAREIIQLGTAPSGNDGDTARTAFTKLNTMTAELYAADAAKQPLAANLTAFAALSGGADRLPYFTGAGALSLAVLTTVGRTLLAASTQAAQQAALGLSLGEPNGAASLGADGKVPAAQIPPIALNDVFTVTSQAAMLALTAQTGDMAIRTDLGNQAYILAADPATTLGNWMPIQQSLAVSLQAIGAITPAADTLPYFTGAATAASTSLTAHMRAALGDADAAATKTRLALNNVDNTADLNKPISLATQAAINAIPSATGKNRIRNANMLVAQRGVSFPALSPIIGSYTLDGWRWAGSSTTALATIVRGVGPDFLNQNSWKATVTTADAAVAAADKVDLQHRIEGFNIGDLVNTDITLSFWVKSAKVGTYSITLKNGAIDRTLIKTYSIVVANTWEFKTITIVGGINPTGSWDYDTSLGLMVSWSLMCGTTGHGAADTWLTTASWATSAQPNCMDTVGNVFELAGVQLEKGSAFSKFERLLIEEEEARALRYFVNGIANGRAVTFSGNVTSGSSYSSRSYFPARMRATPTVVLTPSPGANFPDSAGAPNINAGGIQEVRTANATGPGSFTSQFTASAEL